MEFWTGVRFPSPPSKEKEKSKKRSCRLKVQVSFFISGKWTRAGPDQETGHLIGPVFYAHDLAAICSQAGLRAGASLIWIIIF